MNWFKSLFGTKSGLSSEEQQRLADWQALPRTGATNPLTASRLVVVDVEASGLNLARDRLIAIGAVAIKDGRIDVDDSFEIVLQQAESSSHENILIHGIGGEAQKNGVPPQKALLDFLAYLGKSPLVAFHVTFDETMIRNAIRQFLGFRLKHEWLDLAYVMPGLYPHLSNDYRTLEQWQERFGIQNPARHNAIADALSTAQLFMVAARHAQQKRLETYQNLQQLEKAQRWVSWQQ